MKLYIFEIGLFVYSWTAGTTGRISRLIRRFPTNNQKRSTFNRLTRRIRKRWNRWRKKYILSVRAVGSSPRQQVEGCRQRHRNNNTAATTCPDPVPISICLDPNTITETVSFVKIQIIGVVIYRRPDRDPKSCGTVLN